MVSQTVATSERLTLRRVTVADAPFLLTLLNDPSFHAFIGDRGVRTLDDAQRYAEERMLASYAARGFGMYLVASRASGEPFGLCGLVRRDTLPEPDLGFALLPAYWGQGYAREAAALVLDHARDDIGLERVAAIVKPDNAASIRLLERLGFVRDGEEREGLLYLSKKL